VLFSGIRSGDIRVRGLAVAATSYLVALIAIASVMAVERMELRFLAPLVPFLVLLAFWLAKSWKYYGYFERGAVLASILLAVPHLIRGAIA
jgi:hypothetical protein